MDDKESATKDNGSAIFDRSNTGWAIQNRESATERELRHHLFVLGLGRQPKMCG
ncbi:hypothetical protein [Oceanobacillus picturae]|uniref:hypothetical protein n=1 Tax=Oceanobacillus picturae TaxID=171693 RepID=UPI000A722326|nr:hypothetical protein [Oceanobacillus picturae]